MAPGAMHHARWMAKAQYFMVLVDADVKLSDLTADQVRNVNCARSRFRGVAKMCEGPDNGRT